MTKFGQFITTFLIGLFIIALGAMIALSNMREQPPVERTLKVQFRLSTKPTSASAPLFQARSWATSGRA